jgi:DNA modification methylase
VSTEERFRPYYQDGLATIYHGDAREILPTLDVTDDVIVTDSPYGVGLAYGEYIDTVENLDALIGWARDSFLDPLRVRRAAVFTGVGNMHRWPQPTWSLCWLDPGGIGSSAWGFATWQPILVYGADPYLAAGKGRRPDSLRSMLGRRPHAEDRDGSGVHVSPKPLDVMAWLIGRVSINPAERIVDPFVGSGSTLVVAKQLGHRCIGIDLDERYCEIAASRMAQGVLWEMEQVARGRGRGRVDRQAMSTEATP